MQGNEYLGTVLVLCGCCSVISLVLAAVALNISQDSDPANINIGDNYGLDPASGNIRSLPAGYWIPPWIKYDSAGRRVFSIQVGSDWPGQSYRYLPSNYFAKGRTPSINAQCRSKPIKIVALIPMSINSNQWLAMRGISDQCHDFDRHWSALIEGVLQRCIIVTLIL